jgi:hypothetical protein
MAGDFSVSVWLWSKLTTEREQNNGWFEACSSFVAFILYSPGNDV